VHLKQEGEYLLSLNQSFNQEWKLVPDVDLDKYKPGFLQDIQMFTKPTLSEENHYLVNGYANLWYIPRDNSRQVMIIYKPQIMKDILWKISSFLFWLILGGVVWQLINMRRKQ
jgi:hypothetical protein